MKGYFGLAARLFLALGLLGLPVRVSAQIAVEFYHLDSIGNVLAVTDNVGAVVEQHDYDVFGQEVNAQAGAQSKRFTGKERDQETGWDYFGARYYGSRIGRFTTTDPVYAWLDNIVDPQRWNRFAYGRDNPLRYVDPDGRKIIVADSLRGEYDRARAYLGVGATGADSVLKELDDLKDVVVTIVQTSGLDIKTDVAFKPGENVIYWNPNASLRTNEGGTQSPALTLLHEADHALQANKKKAQFEADLTPNGSRFDNKEEERVIRGSEARAAGIKGEAVRDNHRGSLEKVQHSDERAIPNVRMPE
jgi:RHS repeat-associated protein